MTALVIAVLALSGVAMLCLAALKAWRGWLDLKRFEIASRHETERGVPDLSPSLRIEMADPRERLKKLETIATGVDP